MTFHAAKCNIGCNGSGAELCALSLQPVLFMVTMSKVAYPFRSRQEYRAI